MILGFKDRFVPRILDGTKVHSVRAGNRWKPGMVIHFYQHVRRPTMRKIRADAVCVGAHQIRIYDDGFVTCWGILYTAPDDLQAFATNDGFDSWTDLAAYLRATHGLPFTGQLVQWVNYLPY